MTRRRSGVIARIALGMMLVVAADRTALATGASTTDVAFNVRTSAGVPAFGAYVVLLETDGSGGWVMTQTGWGGRATLSVETPSSPVLFALWIAPDGHMECALGSLSLSDTGPSLFPVPLGNCSF